MTSTKILNLAAWKVAAAIAALEREGLMEVPGALEVSEKIAESMGITRRQGAAA